MNGVALGFQAAEDFLATWNSVGYGFELVLYFYNEVESPGRSFEAPFLHACMRKKKKSKGKICPVGIFMERLVSPVRETRRHEDTNMRAARPVTEKRHSEVIGAASCH